MRGFDMSRSSWYNAKLRKEHIPVIVEFCKDAGFSYKFVNGFEWHIRIENVLDVFPTRNRWYWLPTGERGSFNDHEELGQIFMDRKSTKDAELI
jgi:hypothetical protein